MEELQLRALWWPLVWHCLTSWLLHRCACLPASTSSASHGHQGSSHHRWCGDPGGCLAALLTHAARLPACLPLPSALPCRATKGLPTTVDAVTLGDAWLQRAISEGLIQPIPDARQYRWWVSAGQHWRKRVLQSMSLQLEWPPMRRFTSCS